MLTEVSRIQLWEKLPAVGNRRGTRMHVGDCTRWFTKLGNNYRWKVSTVRLWVRTSRRRVHLIPTNYPVLRIRDWVDCIFRHGGHFFLGGNTLDDNAKAFRGELDRFWRNYRKIDPTFPFFRDNSECCYEHCIPIALHGDEGRGRAKQPILVMSVQPLLPLNDGKTNMQGYLERIVTFPYSVMFFRYRVKTQTHHIISLKHASYQGQLFAPGCSTQCCLLHTRRRASTIFCRSWPRIWNRWTKMDLWFLMGI